MTAPCIAPALAYNRRQAPEKRELERLPVPVSDGFFTPGIRPNSARVASSPCREPAGSTNRKAVRCSQVQFLRPARSRRPRRFPC